MQNSRSGPPRSPPVALSGRAAFSRTACARCRLAHKEARLPPAQQIPPRRGAVRAFAHPRACRARQFAPPPAPPRAHSRARPARPVPPPPGPRTGAPRLPPGNEKPAAPPVHLPARPSRGESRAVLGAVKAALPGRRLDRACDAARGCWYRDGRTAARSGHRLSGPRPPRTRPSSRRRLGGWGKSPPEARASLRRPSLQAHHQRRTGAESSRRGSRAA
jgi:hypothetical protein